MTISAQAIVLAVICNLGACTTPDQETPSPTPIAAPESAAALAPALATPDEVSVLVARTLVPPTPAMLKAALADDRDAMRDAIMTLSGCHSASICPPEFASCASWSTSSPCATFCGPVECFCKPGSQCDGEDLGPRGGTTFNSFRVCFNSAQVPCTEWRSTNVTSCGC
jgi:hypothetical protein